MRNVMIVFRREFAAYFNSTLAYLFLIAFLVLNSAWFMSSFFLANQADMRQFFGMLPVFNLFFLPAVSMRLWSEDKGSGTIELLMTLPMRTWEVVVGKYLASLVFYVVALAATFMVPVVIKMTGNPDMGSIVAAYIGSVFLGAFYLGIGIFVSGLFREQMSAFIVTVIACFFAWFLGHEIFAATVDGWISGFGSFLQRHLAFTSHFESIQRGVIDTRNIVYFVSMTALFLGLNAVSLEGRRY